jgi:hypothetical protein
MEAVDGVEPTNEKALRRVAKSIVWAEQRAGSFFGSQFPGKPDLDLLDCRAICDDHRASPAPVSELSNLR